MHFKFKGFDTWPRTRIVCFDEITVLLMPSMLHIQYSYIYVYIHHVS